MSVDSHLMEPPAVVNTGENYYTLKKKTTPNVIISSVFPLFKFDVRNNRASQSYVGFSRIFIATSSRWKIHNKKCLLLD